MENRVKGKGVKWLIFTELSQDHLRSHGCIMTHFLPQCQGAALRDKLEVMGLFIKVREMAH